MKCGCVDVLAEAIVSLEQALAQGFDPAGIVVDIVPVAQPVGRYAVPFGEGIKQRQYRLSIRVVGGVRLIVIAMRKA